MKKVLVLVSSSIFARDYESLSDGEHVAANLVRSVLKNKRKRSGQRKVNGRQKDKIPSAA